ncbi:MAG: hypothetical protein ACI8V5_002893, partial [Limisphaerales bacterium]
AESGAEASDPKDQEKVKVKVPKAD